MIHKISDNDKVFYIDIPDDLNKKQAINVLLKDRSTWKDNGPITEYDQNDVTHFAEVIHPSIFIDEEEGKLLPFMSYFEMIDKKFFENMMYYWSKINDASLQEFLDKIDENKDFIINVAIIKDVFE